MNGLNRIFLMGHLGSAPQAYQTKSGGNYTSLNIATNRHMGHEDGQSKTVTDWHYVRVWGPTAENCVKYLDKGSHVFVEGYLTQYSRVSEGKTDRRTGINALRVDFLPRTIKEAMAETSRFSSDGLNAEDGAGDSDESTAENTANSHV